MNKMCKMAETRRNLHTHTHTHACLYKIIFSAIFAIATTIPTFATNITDSNKGCTSGNLETSSGSTALEADWQANTVGVTFYNGDTQFDTGQCTYDGTLTLPDTDPTKTGYTFAGWKVRAISQSPLANLDTSIAATLAVYKNDGETCIMNYVVNCAQNERVNRLGANDWEADYSYGTIYGTVKLSAKIGDRHDMQWGGDSADWTATTSELDTAGTGKACWCQITGFKPINGDYISISSSKWVLVRTSETWCSHACAKSYQKNSSASGTAFRTALFSIAGQ